MAADIEKKQETTIRDFLNVVFRRKMMIIYIVLIATVVVVFLNARQPTVYESSSRVLIKRGERASVFSGSVRYLPWEEEISSQLELILSRPVFSRAREILTDSASAKGIKEPSKFKGGYVRADVVGGSNVISISYTDPDPAFAQRACGAVTESFIEYYKKRTAPPALSDYFADQIQDVRTELDFWKEKKKEFLNKKMFFGAAEEGRYLLAKLSSLESQLSTIRADLAEQQQSVSDLQMLIAMKPDEIENKLSISVSTHYLQSGIISNLKFNLQNLKLRREDLLSKYTPRHPEVIALDNQIKDLQNQLKDEIMNYYYLEHNKLLQIMEQEKLVEKKIKQTKADLDAIPDKDHDLESIDDRIAIVNSKLELLLKKQDEAEIALASTPAWDVTVLTPASKAYPKKTKDYIRIALGPFFSFIVALGLAFFFESLDHSLRTSVEVEEYLNLPVLGTISEMSGEK